MITVRYRFNKGITDAWIKKTIQLTATLVQAKADFIDIQLDETVDGALTSTDEIMAAEGFVRDTIPIESPLPNEISYAEEYKLNRLTKRTSYVAVGSNKFGRRIEETTFLYEGDKLVEEIQKRFSTDDTSVTSTIRWVYTTTTYPQSIKIVKKELQ